MRIIIIADDLTGASDSGVPFARRGLKTSVLLHRPEVAGAEDDVVVFDTDSRSAAPEEAYSLVKATLSYIPMMQPFDLIFKKIDSTLRGNTGAELQALYDHFQPDFIVCTPAYPAYGRRVQAGYLYVDGTLLHESGFARDPKTPVTESFIPSILGKQTTLGIGLLSAGDLAGVPGHLRKKLLQFQAAENNLLIADGSSDEDLNRLAGLFEGEAYRIVWAGSAGLANSLAARMGRYEARGTGLPNTGAKSSKIAATEYPVLTVIGSVNRKTRNQLEILLSRPDVMGIELNAVCAVSDLAVREAEMGRVFERCSLAFRRGLHIALYSSGGVEAIRLATQTGVSSGLSPKAVSDQIASVLGETAARLVLEHPSDRVVLTGGDTANQFCRFLDVKKFELFEEVEKGVPVGVFSGTKEIVGVTKAGGLGSDEVLLRALEIVGGEKTL